jgi:isochorismate synthase EntC
MPQGKPAGVRCVQLDERNACRLFGKPDRPAVCASLRPTASMCGSSREEAMEILAAMEIATLP